MRLLLDYCDGGEEFRAVVLPLGYDSILALCDDDGEPWRLVRLRDWNPDIAALNRRMWMRADSNLAALELLPEEIGLGFPLTLTSGAGCYYEGVDEGEPDPSDWLPMSLKVVPPCENVVTEEELAALMGGPEDYDR